MLIVLRWAISALGALVFHSQRLNVYVKYKFYHSNYATQSQHITNCAPLLADISMYSFEAVFIAFALDWRETSTYRYIDEVLSINTQDFQNYLSQMYPAELEIRLRATPLLPTWIYSCRSGEMVSCAIPFMTNVTISTSISQTFHSGVAIFNLRQPTVCLSHSSYGMPGLATLRNVLFWERRDFHVSFSGRDMSGNVWTRPSWSYMVDMGISLDIMKSLSPKCYMTFWDMIIYSDTQHWSNISPNRDRMTN